MTTLSSTPLWPNCLMLSRLTPTRYGLWQQACVQCQATCGSDAYARGPEVCGRPTGGTLLSIVARARRTLPSASVHARAVDRLDVRNVDGLVIDIDALFAVGGRETHATYGALMDLRTIGYALIGITSKPAGWSDHIARTWPFTAVIGSDGQFYFMQSGGTTVRRHLDANAASALHIFAQDELGVDLNRHDGKFIYAGSPSKDDALFSLFTQHARIDAEATFLKLADRMRERFIPKTGR